MATKTIIAPTLEPAVSVFAAPYAAEGPLIAGTSATPNTIDVTVNKTFTIAEYNRSFNVGTRLRATAVGFTDTFLEGIVTAWDGEIVTIDGDLAHNASATVYSNWSITVAGQPGIQGIQGPTGPQGPSGGPTGPAGPPGAPGSVWRNGVGVPANSLGVDGDYYLDDNTGDVYMRATSIYSIVANIEGAPGATGAAGPVGPTGPQGIIADAPSDGGYYARRNANWETPPGGGNVSVAGTPVAGQTAQWTSANTITGIDAVAYAPLASPTFTGTPAAPTPILGDNDTSIATTAFVQGTVNGLAVLKVGDTMTGALTLPGNPTSALQAAPKQYVDNAVTPAAGRLTYVSPTQLKFAPFNGANIRIAGAFLSIPSTGITIDNTGIYLNGSSGQNLAANATYYLYAFNSSGTVTIDFRNDGNGHITDTTAGNVGTEVRCSVGTTPDSSRTLIGMIRTNASSQFVDSALQRFVRSWFNRRSIQSTSKLSARRTAAGAVWVELESAARCEFLTWNDEAANFQADGAMFATAGAAYFGISLDGANPVSSTRTDFTTNGPASAMMTQSGISEGYHYATMMGVGSGGGTATFGPSSETAYALFNRMGGIIS
jgi:hypothetical protein